MTKSYKCIINDFPEKNRMIINPILDYYTVLEKVNVRMIYSPFFKKHFVVKHRLGIYPIYLPELGQLISLETISPKVTKRFYEETKDYESFYSENKVISSKLYHYKPQYNRVVSCSQFEPYKIPPQYYQLYISSLVNDLFLLPSLVKKFGLISPNRWFIVDSHTAYYFRAEVNYNIGLMYLRKEWLKHPKKLTLWMNSPIDVYETKAGFLKISVDGKVTYFDKIWVHFLTDPSEDDNLILYDKGDYFISFLLSFNKYETNFYKYKRRKFNINLIENLLNIVYSNYELVPFLFPEIIPSMDIKNKLVFKFQIKENCIKQIISTMMKFASFQHPDFVGSFNQLFENQNKLFRINKKGNYLEVKIVNPTVVPFLIKQFLLGRKSVVPLLEDPDTLLDKLEEIQQATRVHWLPLVGIGKFLRKRENLLLQYSSLWKNSQT